VSLPSVICGCLLCPCFGRALGPAWSLCRPHPRTRPATWRAANPRAMTSTARLVVPFLAADVYDLPWGPPGAGLDGHGVTWIGGTLGPANQIDDARWVPLGEAPGLLSYEHDRRLLEGGQPAQ
jgi:hypothetical protein